jgi:glycerol-3-phosphate dehydrogenase
VLALPFAEDSMLIGPAEQDHSGDAAAPAPSAADIASLCALADHYFRRAIQLDDVTPFARIRVVPAVASCPWTPPAPHRLLHLDAPRGLAPLLTVCDGPVVLARRLAQAALDRIACFFAATPAWTATAPLPGGDFTPDALEIFTKESERRWPFLCGSHARRLVSSYGTRLERILCSAAQSSDLGERFGADLTAAEVRYLMREEWAETADDMLWRRSALGFGFAAAEREALAQFMAAEQRVGSRAALTAPHEWNPHARPWPRKTKRHAAAEKFRLIRTPSVRNKRADDDHCGIPHATWFYPLGRSQRQARRAL